MAIELLYILVDVGTRDAAAFSRLKAVVARYVQQKYLSLSNSSYSQVGLMLVGSELTSNALREQLGEGQYSHVSDAVPLQAPNRSFFEHVEELAPEGQPGDVVDGIVVALTALGEAAVSGRGASTATRKIAVFTDLSSCPYVEEGLSDIKQGLATFKIDLMVYVENPPIDFEEVQDNALMDHDDLSETEKTRIGNQVVLASLTENLFDTRDMMAQLRILKPPMTEPRPMTFNLEIGDSIKIPLKMYVKVSAVKPLAHRDVAILAPSITEMSVAGSGSTQGVSRQQRLILDSAGTDVLPADTIKAYKYGKQLIPLHDIDVIATKLETVKNFRLLCFCPDTSVPRMHWLSAPRSFVPDPKDCVAVEATKALVAAMIASKKHAVVRFVYRAGLEPKLGLLVPHAKSAYSCLEYVEIPFSEDIRDYPFRSFQQIKDNLSREEIDAMDALIHNLTPSDPREVLHPKVLADGNLQLFYEHLHSRFLDPAHKVTTDIPSDLRNLVFLEDSVLHEAFLHAVPSISNLASVFTLKATEAEKDVRKRTRFWFDSEEMAAVAAANAELELVSKKSRSDGGVDAFGSSAPEMPSAAPLPAAAAAAATAAPVLAPAPAPAPIGVTAVSGRMTTAAGAANVAAVLGQYRFDRNDPVNSLNQMMQVPQHRGMAVVDMIGLVERQLELADDADEPRFYDRALSYLEALRTQCISYDFATAFNDQLQSIWLNRAEAPELAHTRFFDQLKTRKLMLIHEGECPSAAGVSIADAIALFSEDPATSAPSSLGSASNSSVSRQMAIMDLLD
eukprot:ANDGO_08184.mRNA.1 ATP-dependent DNA helicase 2 subunit KU80